MYPFYSRSPLTNVDRVFSAFDEGTVGGNWLEDATATVVRADLDNQLEGLMRPARSKKYVVIVGEHGTGKSVAARKAARKKHTDGSNGVVYLSVGMLGSNVGPDLAKVVGYKAHALEVAPSLFDVIEDIKAAAIRFCIMRKRPATLVLDNIDIIAKKDPTLLVDLQRFAKDMADAGYLRVVFVSSDGTAPTLMKAQSEWSRAQTPAEVGDIDDKTACAYLVQAGISAGTAMLIVDRLTGGRFALLSEYVNAGESMDAAFVDAKAKQLHDELWKDLRKMQVPHDHPFLKKLAMCKVLNNKDSIDLGFSEDRLALLLEANVIAAHPNSTYTFHSRYVERFFEAASLPPLHP